ncbi:MAG: arsenic efflux protein [Clostridia bacterium]|nr:arsenic efflux protein [Clostridia bacterium]
MWHALEHFFEDAGHNLLHALEHTWPLLPFLFLIYALMELLENRADLQKVRNLGGKLGPLVGAATGLVPQCGFSVMAAKLFERKYITVGALLSIFMATSDEAFIIMLSSGKGAVWLLPLLLSKIVIAVGVGYAVDGLLRLIGKKQLCMEMPKTNNGVPESTKEIFIQRYLEEKEVQANCSCGRQHEGESAWKNYLLYPLLHTLKVGFFILLVNFVLGTIIHEVGEETFVKFMQKNRFLQPFITCVIGLIPNCASSVVITETFLGGGITFGSCVAGLCVNAGMGFVVLLRNTRQWKRNVLLITVSYVISVIIGVLFNLIYPISVSLV